MYQLLPNLSARFILNNVSQEEIFEYCGIPVRYNTFFCSPLRTDEHPTCSFKWIGEYLYFRDWAEEHSYNCFQMIKRIHNCSYGEALELVYEKFVKKLTVIKPEYTYEVESSPAYRSKSKIQVKLSKWQPEVIDYLKSYHINKGKCVKFNIFPIEKVWVNGKLSWKYQPNDPAIAYYFGVDEQGNKKWKIYFYTRRVWRFIGNTNRINGWIQIPERGDLLVITKSLKDVVCFDTFGVPAIAMQNESTIPYDYIIEELRSRFTKIISFYDFDRTGVVNANKLKRLYNIPYIFLTNGRYGTVNFGAKDFSDYLKHNGKQHAYNFLQHHKIIL